MRVLIAGGGIGGLTAALSLLNHGIDVDAYEQAAELKEVGAGVQLAANGTRVLQALGVGDELKALSCEAQGKEIRHWQTGETWKLFDLGPVSIERYGAPYFTVFRPDLLAVLAQAVVRAKPDALHLGARCRGFTQDDDSVTLQLKSGATVRGDALVGADGVHSRIRQALFGADRPEFTGVIAWRGVVPMERLPSHMARMVGSNWVGPGGHIVHYPLRAGRLMNFVGARARGAPRRARRRTSIASITARSPIPRKAASSSIANGRASASPIATNGSSATTLLRWRSDAARRARVALWPGRLACRGARLSLEADPSHRAVPAGRADRHRRPPRRPEALRGTRPARRHRQPRGRWGHRRLDRRRKGAAGRLHAPLRQHEHARHRARAVSRSRVRPEERLCADQPGIARRHHRRGERARARAHAAGVHRARQEDARQALVLVRRQRHAAASCRRAFQDGRRRRLAAR